MQKSYLTLQDLIQVYRKDGWVKNDRKNIEFDCFFKLSNQKIKSKKILNDIINFKFLPLLSPTVLSTVDFFALKIK